MQEKIFPNFWEGLGITILVILLLGSYYALCFVLLERFSLLKYYFYVEIVYTTSSFLLIPVLIIVKNKSKINLKGQFNIPTIWCIISLFVVAISFQLLNKMLFERINNLFELISNSKVDLIKIHLPKLDRVIILQLIHGVLLAPIFEELLFRGIILKQFLGKYSPIVAIMLSSLLFSLCHMKIEVSVSLFIMSVIIGILYCITRSLTLSVILHSFSNAFSFVFTFNSVHITPVIIIKYLIVVFLSIGTLILIYKIYNKRYCIYQDRDRLQNKT